MSVVLWNCHRLAQELLPQEIRDSILFTAAGIVPPKEQSCGLGLFADCLVNLTLLDTQQFSKLPSIHLMCSFLHNLSKISFYCLHFRTQSDTKKWSVSYLKGLWVIFAFFFILKLVTHINMLFYNKRKDYYFLNQSFLWCIIS